MVAKLAFPEVNFQASGNGLFRMIFAVIHRAIFRNIARVLGRSPVDEP